MRRRRTHEYGVIPAPELSASQATAAIADLRRRHMAAGTWPQHSVQMWRERAERALAKPARTRTKADRVAVELAVALGCPLDAEDGAA